MNDRLTRLIETQVHQACILEVRAHKVGNVHPESPVADMTVADFYRSAEACAPVLARCDAQTVGQTILAAVQATRTVVSTNTNLGIIMLFAPLCAGMRSYANHHASVLTPLRQMMSVPQTHVARVLHGLSIADAVACYDAIRLAEPGGLKKVNKADIHDVPRITLLEAMELAQDRDMIARQYVTSFADVFEFGVEHLCEDKKTLSTSDAIVLNHLRWLAEFGDSLVTRRFGDVINAEVKERASLALRAVQRTRHVPIHENEEVRQFDHWLRSPIHPLTSEQQDAHTKVTGKLRAINPGTSADLVAATILVGLNQGVLEEELSTS